MKRYPIQLTANHSNWRLFMVRKADPAFRAYQQKVLQRDAYTCQFCGFCAQDFMDVINLNGDFHQNRLMNLVTACCFCSQCFFLESVGRDEFGGGTLIVLPEMTQGELNAFCHVLFTAIVSNATTAQQARNLYRSLKLRAQLVEKQLGDGMSNPALLGRLLVDFGERASLIHQQIHDHVRLLPDLARFAGPLKSWIETSLTTMVSLPVE